MTFQITDRPNIKGNEKKNKECINAILQTFTTGSAIQFDSRQEAHAARNAVAYRLQVTGEWTSKRIRNVNCKVWVESR